MIGQTQKPVEEIVKDLEGKEKIIIIGCGGCARIFRTGGDVEMREMERVLSEKGKKIVAAIAVPPNEFTCYAPQTRTRLARYGKEIEGCDAILMLCCGDGLQVVSEIVLEGDFKTAKPVYPGVDTMGLMGGGPALFKEKCQQCGQCVVGMFAGICPLTQCAKGLLNGPCGGTKNGKCETDAEKDCAWMKIYERMKVLGLLENMKEIIAPKDWSRKMSPRKIEVKTG